MTRTTDSHTSNPDSAGKPTDRTRQGGDRTSTSDQEQLAEHLRSIEGVDEDIAEVLANNWQRVLGALLLVLIGVWLVHEFREAKATRRAAAAERLSAVQQAYGSLREQPAAPDEEEAADAAEQAGSETQPEAGKLFEENAELLVSTNDGTVYGDFALLYQAARLAREGNHQGARTLLEQFDLDVTEGSLKDREVLTAEMASLLYARTLVAEGALEKARDYLESLTRERRLVAVEALLLLARLAENDPQLARAKELAGKLKTRRPELAEDVDRELAAIGISLKDE